MRLNYDYQILGESVKQFGPMTSLHTYTKIKTLDIKYIPYLHTNVIVWKELRYGMRTTPGAPFTNMV